MQGRKNDEQTVPNRHGICVVPGLPDKRSNNMDADVGLSIEEEQNLYDLCKWFEFIAIYGRPPEGDEEGDDSLLFL